eukprot:TRINITY_DN38832_c0_g1_i1.p1 TRINITY_DN38832_c0_g1~~TRINITY_DN38832_c0_g1_i1.p1  ORF type:complete len:158 (-),score=24.97 TRINITY_DN38832_c0_g1_i1:108-530(-)
MAVEQSTGNLIATSDSSHEVMAKTGTAVAPINVAQHPNEMVATFARAVLERATNGSWETAVHETVKAVYKDKTWFLTVGSNSINGFDLIIVVGTQKEQLLGQILQARSGIIALSISITIGMKLLVFVYSKILLTLANDLE